MARRQSEQAAAGKSFGGGEVVGWPRLPEWRETRPSRAGRALGAAAGGGTPAIRWWVADRAPALRRQPASVPVSALDLVGSVPEPGAIRDHRWPGRRRTRARHAALSPRPRRKTDNGRGGSRA